MSDSDEPIQPRPAGQAIPERWLKYLPIMIVGHMLVTVPTFVISLALAYATFVQADATRKIQLSETWPYVAYGTGNQSDAGEAEIAFRLTNDGVGPAKVEAVELRYGGKPMSDPRHFLQTCCGYDPASPVSFVSGPVTGVLRPGESAEFIRLPKRPDNAALWDRLETERWKVTVRSCYCSVFDDCWVMESGSLDPRQVEACPADWTLFEERPNQRPRLPAAN
jgi:hypothetical protein